MSKPLVGMLLLLAACAGGQKVDERPAPNVAVCGPAEQGPPLWNGQPVDGRSTPANPKPAAEIMLGKRVAGAEHLRLPQSSLVYLTDRHLELVQINARLCIDQSGAVEKVCLVNPSGHPAADATLIAGMAEWRFEPATLAGQAVKVCQPYVFNYTFMQH